jgi:predicted RNase H-like HicB family nuclease
LSKFEKTNKMKAKIKFTAIFQEAKEGGYTTFIEEIPGVNTQGDTLKEAKENLIEAFELVMDTQRMLSKKNLKNSKFIREPLELAS